MLDDFGFADLEQLGRFFNRDTLRRSTRIADEGGMILVRRREHHIGQFVFVCGRQGDDVGQAA